MLSTAIARQKCSSHLCYKLFLGIVVTAKVTRFKNALSCQSGLMAGCVDTFMPQSVVIFFWSFKGTEMGELNIIQCWRVISPVASEFKLRP